MASPNKLKTETLRAMQIAVLGQQEETGRSMIRPTVPLSSQEQFSELALLQRTKDNRAILRPALGPTPYDDDRRHILLTPECGVILLRDAGYEVFALQPTAKDCRGWCFLEWDILLEKHDVGLDHVALDFYEKTKDDLALAALHMLRPYFKYNLPHAVQTALVEFNRDLYSSNKLKTRSEHRILTRVKEKATTFRNFRDLEYYRIIDGISVSEACRLVSRNEGRALQKKYYEERNDLSLDYVMLVDFLESWILDRFWLFPTQRTFFKDLRRAEKLGGRLKRRDLHGASARPPSIAR